MNVFAFSLFIRVVKVTACEALKKKLSIQDVRVQMLKIQSLLLTVFTLEVFYTSEFYHRNQG